MKVLIVGNGPSLLKVEKGSLIDTFDHIVRFNAYAIDGYEKHVGSRTDCWVNTINYQAKRTEKRLKVNYDRIIWHSWQWDKLKDKGFISFTDFFNGKILIDKTRRETISAMQHYTDDDQYFTYSTGAIAIWMYLQDHDKITVTGFDWWEGPKHHYSDNAPRGTNHNPQKEYVFIKNLVDEGRVEFL